MTNAPMILLAEDDADDLFLFERAMQRLRVPYPLHTVRDGRAVIDYLAGTGMDRDREEHPFPLLLILDMALPKCDGEEIFAWIKNQLELPKLFIVILSGGFYRRPNVQTIESLGNATVCNAPFLKPPNPEMVLTIIKLFEQWLRQEQPAAAKPSKKANENSETHDCTSRHRD